MHMAMRRNGHEHHAVLHARPTEDSGDEHTPEYRALLRTLLRSTRTVIDALRVEASDPVILGAAVRDYVQRALNAGISRARIRDALELLAHEHGGRRWSGMATTIASVATNGSSSSVNCSAATTRTASSATTFSSRKIDS